MRKWRLAMMAASLAAASACTIIALTGHGIASRACAIAGGLTGSLVLWLAAPPPGFSRSDVAAWRQLARAARRMRRDCVYVNRDARVGLRAYPLRGAWLLILRVAEEDARAFNLGTGPTVGHEFALSRLMPVVTVRASVVTRQPDGTPAPLPQPARTRAGRWRDMLSLAVLIAQTGAGQADAEDMRELAAQILGAEPHLAA
jgi:hypothetical protein